METDRPTDRETTSALLLSEPKIELDVLGVLVSFVLLSMSPK